MKKLLVGIIGICLLWMGVIFVSYLIEGQNPNKQLLHSMRKAGMLHGYCGVDLTSTVQQHIPIGMNKENALSIVERNGFDTASSFPVPEKLSIIDIKKFFGLSDKDIAELKEGDLDYFNAIILEPHPIFFAIASTKYYIGIGLKNEKVIKIKARANCPGL